jgi:hypothetical protein
MTSLRDLSNVFWERRRPGEQTPNYLGRVLDELGFSDMARRAREGHFDDFFAPAEVADGMEILRLYNELAGKLQVVRRADRPRVRKVMEAVKAGEFDATKEESDRWAAMGVPIAPTCISAEKL